MTRSRKLIFGCLAFLAGIALYELCPIQKWPFIFIVSLLLASFLFWRRFVFLLIILIVVGDFWAGLFAPKIDPNHIAFYNGQEKEFSAIIADEPERRFSFQRLVVQPKNWRGKVQIKTNLFPEFHYGDDIRIKCKLEAPNDGSNFRYENYLARGGIYSLCERPEIALTSRGQGVFFIDKILRFKNFAVEKLNQTMVEPQASLLLGILLGERAGMPNKLVENFQTVGLSHIVAVSGFNVTIIAVFLTNIAPYLYINRKRAFWLILCFLFIFVILTGVSASVVRAAIMVGLVLFAGYLGRGHKQLNILILAAALMTAVNPKILLWDAGFQLSFLSMFGLIFLAPRLVPKLRFLPTAFAIRKNTASTLSALAFTLPLLLFNFHRLSFVAPFVNVLVLPVVPLSMLLGFFQFLSASVFDFFGQIISWFSWVLLTYIVKVAELFSKLPGAAVEIRIGFWLMLAIYVILIFIVFRSQKKFLHKTVKSDRI